MDKTDNDVVNVCNGNKPPRAYDDCYQWNLYRVPRKIKVKGKLQEHPGRKSAIFVVHGIGDQSWTTTAASLRSGFEDAFEAIAKWQRNHPSEDNDHGLENANGLPLPFILDGYWSNYSDLEKTFEEDWQRFGEREKTFFGHLWIRRCSVFRTYSWFLRQQVRLLHPRLIKVVGWYYLLYWPLQLVSLFALTLALIRSPKILTQFIADIRLYVDPKGMIERAVVQRIDYRVGEQFLRMLGLDWNFRKLDKDKLIQASGEPVAFERIVWVAHSLGTVISYNVLSDLFHRAEELAFTGDEEQKYGVEQFRTGMRRFVTLGSPLDKIAFLFGKKAIRPWPDQSRESLLYGGEELTDIESKQLANVKSKTQALPKEEWWVNFYSVFDPVSGSLSDDLICGQAQPINLLMSPRLSSLLPGVAHVLYWSDSKRTLRYILGRCYGHYFLRDKEVEPYSRFHRFFLALGGYVFWAFLIVILSYGIINYLPELVKLLL